MTERKRIVVGVAGGHRRLQGVHGGPAARRSRSLRPRRPHRVRAALRRGRHVRGAVRVSPCTPGVFEDVDEVPHVRIGQDADLVVVAPATADLLARAVAGRADDLLTATLLTARCPVLFAPAMHTEMWFHPATVAQRRDAASSRRRRARAGVRSAHRRRQRRRPAAGGRGDHHVRAAAAGSPRRAAVRPGRRQGARHRGRHPRADRPGAVHRQPQFRQAGLRDGPRRRAARRRRHADRRATPRVSSTRPASTSCTSARRASCTTRCPSMPPTRTCW